MKKIITHINPDLDAVASVWLIKRFLPGWEEAVVEFVSARLSPEVQSRVDHDPDVLYTDVGLGKLDHHQTGEYLSAAKLCFSHIKKQRKGRMMSPLEEKALGELVEVVTQIDNARDLAWPEAKKGRYNFYLHDVFDGLRSLGETDDQVVDFSFRALDAVMLNLKNKIRAKQELAAGEVFETPWGQAIALSSANKHVLWVGEIQGYVLVVKKDPETGAVRIYARPDSKVNLSDANRQFKKFDPESDWFLHATKRLLLNDSTVGPGMRPTKLSLPEIIRILKGQSL